MNIQDSLNSQKEQSQQAESARFELIRKVGSKGTYQKILIVIFSCIWGVSSIMSSSIIFFFVQKQFQCIHNGFITNSCQQAVCYLKKQDWGQYLANQNQNRITIATEIGKQNLCSDQVYNNLIISMAYCGNFCGMLIVSTLADKIGRFKVILFSWIFTVIGSVLLVLSLNQWMVGLSLFLISSGANSCLNISFSYLVEFYEDSDIKKYSIFLQMSYSVTTLIMTTLFLLIDDWKIIALISLIIPSTLILIAIIYYLKETTDFLLSHKIQKILKDLNHIGYINSGNKALLSQQDIVAVLKQEKEIGQKKPFETNYTVAHLFKFGSLRIKVLQTATVYFSLFSMYFGFIFFLDQFGLNLYVSSYTLSFSQIPVFPFLYKYIDKIPRKQAAICFFSIIGLSSAILSFTGKIQCTICYQAFIKIFFVAIFKIAVSSQITLMVVYINQLYPNKIKSSAIGFTLSMGALSTIIWPIIVAQCKQNGIDPSLIYTVLAYICLCISFFFTETLGKKIQDQINQVKILKLNKTGQYSV